MSWGAAEFTSTLLSTLCMRPDPSGAAGCREVQNRLLTSGMIFRSAPSLISEGGGSVIFYLYAKHIYYNKFVERKYMV